LELKFAGLVLFAGLPVLAALLNFSEADPRWLLLGIGLAAIPDFLGRCLCLVAPPPAQLWIVLSVLFQTLAFGSLAGSAWFATIEDTDGIVEVCLDVCTAACLQLAAAFLFTRFLRTAGEFLGHPEITHQADQLSWRLACSLIASWALSFTTFLAAGIVIIVGLVTCGLGFYVATPMAAVLLLPLVLLTFGIVVAMYWTYGATMVRLRTAIRSSQPKGNLPSLPEKKSNSQGRKTGRD
jgi:hypothetical protein